MGHQQPTLPPGSASGARVLVAEHHPLTRVGIEQLLTTCGFVVCGAVADATAAVVSACREEPDVCLLDLDIPGSPLAAVQEIVRRLPRTAVVLLTDSSAEEDVVASLRAGASGYLLKTMDPDRIGPALLAVLRGEIAVPRKLIVALVRPFRQNGQRRVALPSTGRTVELTERQWQIFQLLQAGHSTVEIAERLTVSPGTVRSHISGLLRKLRVVDRAAAVRILGGPDQPVRPDTSTRQ